MARTGANLPGDDGDDDGGGVDFGAPICGQLLCRVRPTFRRRRRRAPSRARRSVQMRKRKKLATSSSSSEKKSGRRHLPLHLPLHLQLRREKFEKGGVTSSPAGRPRDIHSGPEARRTIMAPGGDPNKGGGGQTRTSVEGEGHCKRPNSKDGNRDPEGKTQGPETHDRSDLRL